MPQSSSTQTDIKMKTKTRANYRFPLEATNEWKQHLQSKGYCVIANTLNVDEIETSKLLIIEDSFGSQRELHL